MKEEMKSPSLTLPWEGKEKWEMKKLGEVCEIYQPSTIATSQLVSDGIYPVYGANGIIGRYNKYNHEDSEVLMCCRGATCGSLNISKPFSWINGNAMVVRPKDDSITKPFLVYLLQVLDYSKIITGAAQPQITRKSLSPTNVSYPSISSQKNIVRYLDESFAKIDALKANAETSLADAKALFQAELKKAMEPKEGWEEKTLGEISFDICYGTSKPANEGGEYKYLRMNNITNDGFLDLSHYKTISLPQKDLERCLVRKGDILFNRTNSRELVGKSCVFTEDEPMVIAGYIIRIRVNKDYVSQFLTYNMNLQRSLGFFQSLIIGAVHQANISAKNVKTVKIAYPSKKDQQTIVTHLDTLSAKVTQLQQNLERIKTECDALKQALLRQVFE